MTVERQYFKYEKDKKESYNVACWSEKTWSTSKNRFLTILQHVPTDDLKNKRLISTLELNYTYTQFLFQARNTARLFDDIPNFSYAVINYNNEKTAGLKDDDLAEKNVEFTQRCLYLIKKLKPTHVLICGVTSQKYLLKELFPDIEHVDYKRGWVFEKDNVKYTCTIDIFRALLSDGTANTVGFAFQHAANLMLGHNPFDLSKVVPEYKYIRTVQDFDDMLEVLNKSKYVGYDLETKALTVNNNKIYTAQFASSLNPTLGYVLTLDHPQTHWTKEQIVYFKKKLRAFFYKKGNPFLITYNGMFDLRITRQCLKLPIINRECWELMAGEHDLDENVNKLTTIYGVPQGNLRACLCRYNNDFYFRNSFTKEDRATIGNIAPDNPDFLKYGSADAVFAVAVFKMQLKRASYIKVAGKVPYKPLFINHMLNIMSPTAHSLSHLRQDGSYVDMEYMNTLKSSAKSPLAIRAQEIEKEMSEQQEVKAANKLLCAKEGFKSNSLFSQAKEPWILSLSKPEHKTALFFDVMHLKPVSQTSKGLPAVDDTFREAYKYSNLVVSLYDDYQQTNKLLNTYVKSWYRMLTLTDADAIKDHRLRPDYAFYNVLTGRLGSRNPSLQVIPQHSDISKYIKRAFIAPPGYFLVHYDYNAQEVRTWGITAKDNVIADTFRVGQKLRQEYIKNPTEENKQLIKKKGDVHLLNVKRFFNREVDKKHPLRAVVKGVVFATIYMMTPKSMGEQIKQADIIDAKNTLHEAWLRAKDTSLSVSERRKATQDFEKASQNLQSIIDEDRTQVAADTMNKVFDNFKNGKKWIDDTVAMAEQFGYTISPVGRIRHVPSILITQGNVKSRSIRQACNAPIQGFASELAIKASRLVMQNYYEHYKELANILDITSSVNDNRLQYLRVIHDANYYACPYEFLIPFIHMMQYCATYGTAETLGKEFNFPFNIEPEIEMEVTTYDSDSSSTWDWSIPKLLDIIHNAVYEGHKQGFIKEDPESVLKKILAPWRNKECRHHLNTHFPLLGVKDLDNVIGKALENYDKKYVSS